MSVDFTAMDMCTTCMFLYVVKPVQRDREIERERDSKCCTFVVGIWGSFMWVDILGWILLHTASLNPMNNTWLG